MKSLVLSSVKQFSDVWKRKELFAELFKTMLKLRHVGSLLGYLWTLLSPVLYIATYWFVFTYFVKMGIDSYPVFLIPGFLAWNFTLGAVIYSSESIIQSTYLITKVAFPNEILPLVNVGISLLDFIISLAFFFLVLLLVPGIKAFTGLALLLPFVLLIHIFITAGLSLITSALTVYFRDVPKLIQIGGTLLFFLTPIFYPLTMVPEKFRGIIMLNPVAQVISYYHDIIYYNTLPGIYSLIYTFLFSAIILFTGLVFFNKHKYYFAEL